MSFDELQKIRPNVTVHSDDPGASQKPNFSANEMTAEHAGSGATRMLVTYRFEGARLASVMMVWYGQQETFLSAKPRFLGFVLESMGTKFEATAQTQSPGQDTEIQVPALLWQSDDVRALAFAAVQKNSVMPEDTFYVFLIEAKEIRHSAIMETRDESVDKETLDGLFKRDNMPMNGDELQKMAEKPSEQKRGE